MTAFVYVIAVGGDDGPFDRPVKIGITGNTARRLADIRPNSPFGISYAFIQPVSDFGVARLIEQAIHRVFRDDRLGYEWFDVDPFTAALMVEKMTSMEAYFGR